MKKMNTTKRRAISATLLTTAISFFLGTQTTFAKISDYVTGSQGETKRMIDTISGGATPKAPGVIAAEVVQIVLGFLGLIGVIMMLYAGFLWLTAGGEEEKAKQGKTLLFQALIGTLIVLAAYSITYFVLNELTKAIT